jgi:hypothetical protein
MPAFPEAQALALADQTGATLEKILAIKRDNGLRTDVDWAYDKEMGWILLR